MRAISELVSAPNRVMTPANIQTARSNSGEPIWAAITPGLRKMPEPMTPPTTMVMVVKRPRVGRRPDSGALAAGVSELLVVEGTFNLEPGAPRVGIGLMFSRRSGVLLESQKLAGS